MTHSNNCILAFPCNSTNTSSCNNTCQAYITMHGFSGKSGVVGAAGVPIDYRLITIKNSPVRNSQADAYNLLDKYAETFNRQFVRDSIKNVYIFSESPGTGKTTTAAALLNTYSIYHYIGSLKRDLQPTKRPCYFLDVNEWQTIYNEFNRNKVPEHIAAPAAEKYYRTMQYAKETAFVVLDDVGVRTPTEGFRADLHSVINARVTNKLPTVYTSNLPISELATLFGEQRLADRIRDMCVEIPFVGQSKRGKR